MPNIKKKSKGSKSVKACRICLAMDGKMYHLNNYNLTTYYENLTGIDVTNQKGGLPYNLCWECTHRLMTFNMFKKKALRSHNLLNELLKEVPYITPKAISSIDREMNSLTTNLSTKILPTDCDILLQHSPISIEFVHVDITNIKDEDVTEYFSDETKTDTSNENKIDYSDEKVKIVRRRRPARDLLNPDMFTIVDLSYNEQLYEINKRVESENYKNSKYKCNECFKGYWDEQAFKAHMARHTNISANYQCDICKIRFKELNALQTHVTAHMQKFSCKQCPFVTTRRRAAKLHEDYHYGTRYQCKYCKKNFSNLSTYTSHVRKKHSSDYVCPLCGHSFLSTKGLGLHKKLKHRFEEYDIPEDGPRCYRCEVNFISEEALENHLKVSPKHNDKSNPRKRLRKTDESKDETDLDKKKRRGNSTPEEPLPCEQSDLQLPDWLACYRHFRKERPGKNRTNNASARTKCMCEVCGKMFRSEALLLDHSATHTTAGQHRCEDCGMRFQTHHGLNAHRHVHLARSAHACRVCDQRFSMASDLTRHMLVHTGVKPFKCEKCDKEFHQDIERRVHFAYTHMRNPWVKRVKGKSTDRENPPSTPASVPPCQLCMDAEQPLEERDTVQDTESNINTDSSIHT